MKNKNHLIITAFILFAIGISACKKKLLGYRTLPPTNGLVSATVNGQPWSTSFNIARYSIKDPNRFGFGGHIFVNSFATQSFGIDDISLNIPTQKLYSVWTSQRVIDTVPSALLCDLDDDVVLATYRVADSAADNYVTVDSYDNSTNLVKGRFRMTLYSDPNNINAGSYGDTVFIENGTYEVTLSYAP